MTRKDYRLIAEAVHEAHVNMTWDIGPVMARQAVDQIIGSLNPRLAADNQLFDREKFRTAAMGDTTK